MDPVVSPDGTKIAFTRYEYVDSALTSVLYVMKRVAPEWTRRRPIRLAFNASDPDWSADSTKIAFRRNLPGDNGQRFNAEIYVMNADGSHKTNLTRNAAWNDAPTFSRDGEQIAFKSNRDGDYDVWRMSTGGSALTQLTNDPAYEGEPAWQPLP